MGEMIRNSLLSPVFFGGFTVKHRSNEATNYHHSLFSWKFRCKLSCTSARRMPRRGASVKDGLNINSESNKAYNLFDVTPCRVSGSQFVGKDIVLVVSEKMTGTTVECREATEEKALFQQESEDINKDLQVKVLPPWGNIDIYSQSDETINLFEPPKAFGRRAVEKNRVHFLEERNELVLSHRLLMLSRTNKVRSALELFSSMELCSLQPNIHACNSFLSCLIRNEMLSDALRIYEYMKKNEIATGHSHSLILKAVANSLSCESAFEAFWILEGDCRAKKGFDVIVYNTMMSICGKVDDGIQCERLWRNMKESGFMGTKITYRLLVCIFVRCDRNDLAIDAYNEMVQNGMEPGEDAMQAVIGACSREGNWELAFRVFQNMLNSELKPNAIACNALMNLLGKSGNVKSAMRVYVVMKSLGHTPDTYTWNALLGSLYKENRHTEVLHLFKNIKSLSTSQLNIHLYKMALMSCRKMGLWRKALQILWQMEMAGLSVSTSSYNLVIGACEVAKMPKVALQVYERMVQLEIDPDTFTYVSLIRCCIWGSLWDELEDLVTQVEPDSSIYNTAIQGMCLRRKIDQAKKLYSKMHFYGLCPDGKTRAMMLQAYKKNVQKRSSNHHR